MANAAKTLILMPSLDNGKNRAVLTLTTDKSSRGGLCSVAAVEFRTPEGYVTFEMFGDYRKTVKTRPGIATQKAISTLHAEVFTPASIAAYQEEATAFYATKRAKEAADNERRTASMLRTAELSRSTPYGPGHALAELTDSGMDASTALRMLNID